MKWLKVLRGITLLTSLCPLPALAADLTPPATIAFPPGGQYPSSLTVALQCTDDSGGCAGTFYCLGSGCRPTTPYRGTPISILESGTLRFYSVDKSANAEAVESEAYSVAYPDKVPPVVTDLIVPPLYRNLTVPVTVAASDNVGVAGYCLTESKDPASCSWSTDSPVSFTFTSPGPHTVYAFAKDAAGNLSAPLSASVADDPNLIRVSAAADMVYSAGRKILYITSGSSILRYQLSSRSFLAPYQTTGTLSAIDLSPDGRTLAVANESRTSIYLVNLDTDTVTERSFSPAAAEKGIHSVGFGADGSLLAASTTSDGSASPLRRFDPATGGVKVITSLAAGSVVPAAGAHCLAVGSTSYNSLFGVYDVATQSIVRSTLRLYSPAPEIGISRDCTQLADAAGFASGIEAGHIYTNEALVKTVSFPSAMGVVYHPRADIFYLADGLAGNITAYDSASFTSLAAYDAGSAFLSGGGHLKIAPDASLLFAVEDGGIGIIPIAAPIAVDQRVTVNRDTAAAIHLSGTAPSGGTVSWQIATSPAHGTLSGTPPDLTYTPAPSFTGTDSFDFSVSTESGTKTTGTVAITVSADVVAPVISSFTLPASWESPVVPVTSFTATDNSGVAGYCLTEGDSSYDCNWSATAPGSYDFSRTSRPYRPHLLHAYAKDAAGNVSSPSSATVSVAAAGAPPAAPSVIIPSVASGFYLAVTLQGSPAVQYCLTEVNDPSSCTSWDLTQGSTAYTFTGYGPHTLYAFGITPSGNISPPGSATVTLIGQRGEQLAADFAAGNYQNAVYDPAGKIVYLVQSGKVLRYDFVAGTFLTPYLEGKSLAGIDLSPDGKMLAVGNAAGYGVYLVNLETGSSSQVDFTPAAGEPNTAAVAFGSDGALIVGGGVSGVASALLRRYDPVTAEVKVVATSRNAYFPTLQPSPGGKCISLNDGNGNVTIYDAVSQSITSTGNFWQTLYPNRDCSQFAQGPSAIYSYLPHLDFYDATLSGITHSIPTRSLGVAFHPTLDIVYVLDASNTVTAYDSTSFTPLGSYPMKGALALPGTAVSQVRMFVSRDGKMLFALYPDGVGYAQVAGAVAEAQSISLQGDASAVVTLTGRSSRGSSLSYRVVTPPAHGSLAGTPPQLTYTPAAGFLGQDSFSFSVNDGTEESAPASLSIAISSAEPSAPHVSLTLGGSYRSASPSDQPVALSVSSLGISGNVSAPASWCLSETGSAAGCFWSETPPTHYQFTGVFPQGITVTRTLYGFVRDAAGRISGSSPITLSITTPDTTAPVLRGFSLPATYPALTVPFALAAGDNGNGLYYCLSETNSSSNCWWRYFNNMPQSTTFNSFGPHTLYAFVRDGAGNVSGPQSGSVFAVDPPSFTSVPTPNWLVGKPGSYSIVAGGYPLPTLTLSGRLPAGIAFTANGDGTATLSGTPEPGSAGLYTVSVQADDGMGYLAARSLTLTVSRQRQTLQFDPLPSKLVTDAPFTLTVAASSGLPVSLSSSDPAVASLEKSTVTIHGLGFTAITAQQPGDGTFEPASVTRLLNVGVQQIEKVLKISALRDGDRTSVPIANVTGELLTPGDILSVAVNGKPVAVDAQGRFSAAVPLVPGSNMVVTTVRKKELIEIDEARNIYFVDSLERLVLQEPSDGAVVNGYQLTLRGCGPAGELLVTVNGGPSLDAGSTGCFTVPVTLADGLNTVLVSATDSTGSLFTSKRSIVVAPGLPQASFLTPAEDIVLLPYSTVTIGAEVDPQDTVTLEINGVTLDTPELDQGRFFLEGQFDKGGFYTVSVTAKDPAGKSTTVRRNILYQAPYPDGIILPATGKSEPDLKDAMRALQIAVGMGTPTAEELAHGDVAPLANGLPAPDGVIDVQDALVILERVVGLVRW